MEDCFCGWKRGIPVGDVVLFQVLVAHPRGPWLGFAAAARLVVLLAAVTDSVEWLVDSGRDRRDMI